MLWNDVRYALRLMRRSRGFTAVAVVSLALGIGANTAIYTLFYTIVLRQLPVTRPEQLVELVRNTPDEAHWAGYWGWEKYQYLRDHNDVFTNISGMSFDNQASVRMEGSEPETLILENVPGNYFEMLGLKPAIGRLIGAEDVPAGGDGDAVVVSWSYWDRHFHRDRAIVGKRIFYNDAAKTIVGVAPRSYVGPRVGSRTDLWMAVAHQDLTMLARLKPGVSIQQAQAEIDVLYRALVDAGIQKKHPDSRLELLSAGAGLARVRDQFGKPLILLLTVVGLLLLLACINMASMLLARSAGRQREIAVRVGLGASRWQLVRQMLTESVLLSVAGTLVGIVTAYLAVGVLVRIMASGRAFERVEIEVQPDLHLLLFTAGIAMLTGVLFGLAPACYAFRSAPAAAMRQSGKGGDTWFWRLFGKGLVTAQVALSVLLVTGAALFLGHVSRLRNFDLGFRSDHVLLLTLDLSHTEYRREQLPSAYRELLARFEAIPGVRSASVSGCFPLEGCGTPGRYVRAEGHAERWLGPFVLAAPRYFETLGVPLIAGHDFSFRDAGRPRVAIINEAMAQRILPGENPIGKHLTVEGDAAPYEIVGLVGDLKAVELRDAAYPTTYFNTFQESRMVDRFELRTSVAPRSVSAAAQRAVRDVLKTVPVRRVTTLADQVDSNIVPERLIAALSEFFGGLGAVLAGIGLYGLLTYTVARRTNEIGIRMALGATAGGVSRLVMRDALGMVCAGLAMGALMVIWGRPLAASVFRDLKPAISAPLIWGGAAIVAVALLASYMPARRAASVDPIEALRHD